MVKRVAALRVAQLSGTAATFTPDAITPVIQELYPRLSDELSTAGVAIAGPAVACYDHHEDGSVTVHATLPAAELVRPTGYVSLTATLVRFAGLEAGFVTTIVIVALPPAGIELGVKGDPSHVDAGLAHLVAGVTAAGFRWEPIGGST